jgi:hypothetical protein
VAAVESACGVATKIGLRLCGRLIRRHFIRNEIEDGATKKKWSTDKNVPVGYKVANQDDHRPAKCEQNAETRPLCAIHNSPSDWKTKWLQLVAPPTFTFRRKYTNSCWAADVKKKCTVG